MAETKHKEVIEESTKGMKSLRAEDPESEKLQSEGWNVVEIKKVDGVKMHFLQKSKKDE